MVLERQAAAGSCVRWETVAGAPPWNLGVKRWRFTETEILCLFVEGRYRKILNLDVFYLIGYNSFDFKSCNFFALLKYKYSFFSSL